jgi:hypothetical protein
MKAAGFPPRKLAMPHPSLDFLPLFFRRPVAACLILAASSTQVMAESKPRLQILNGSTETIDIFWVKSETERIANGSVAPGEDKIITTTIGHQFQLVGRDDHAEASVTSQVPCQAFRFAPTEKNGVPAFYTQIEHYHGFPIVASKNVNPYALKEAAYICELMLNKRLDVLDAMVKSGARLSIIAHNEFTTDLPEFTRMINEPVKGFEAFPAKDYWDARARGLGGSETDPFCTCAEENVLCYPGDPYPTENILIHEFAHNIHLRGLNNVDPTFNDRLKQTYDNAMKAGLWKGKYASVNHCEYFAEGVQSWFDNNRENDHDHNHVNTRAELIEYIPASPRCAARCLQILKSNTPNLQHA